MEVYCMCEHEACQLAGIEDCRIRLGQGNDSIPWKMIIVDDEEDVHWITRRVLRDYHFANRGLEFISAYSGQEAKQLLRDHPDAALILLDVVMETDDTGLQIVRFIREELNNDLIRIVLRTGQPGKAPERQIITEFDINDYKEKTELTADKLFSMVTASLRTYQLAATLNKNNQKLNCEIAERKIVENKLKESERRMATLMANLPGMAYRCRDDEQRTIEFASAGCFSLTGRSPAELEGNRKIAYADLIFPEDRPIVIKQIREALAARTSFKIVYPIVTITGQKKWVWEQGGGIFDDDGRLISVEGFVSDINEHIEAEQTLRKEVERLRGSMKDRYKFCSIIGKSDAMQVVYDLILQSAATDAGVIITGESGTGKELVARAIHDMSDRKNGPFITVNCGAIPENLIESEFFGYIRGAFSGANISKQGFLEAAEGGTLFLDELGEISLNMQIKLLRALDGGYTPVGGNVAKPTDIRVIAATNRDLIQHVKKGLMREDFFYRIHVIPIKLPPLRARKEDLRFLVDHFAALYTGGSEKPRISGELQRTLAQYDWPGNVRELKNVLHRYFSLGVINFLDGIPPKPQEDTAAKAEHEQILEDGVDLRAITAKLEKNIIVQALNRQSWHRGKVAKLLGIDRKTLAKKMSDYGIEKK